MSVVDTLISAQPGQVVALPLEQVRPSVDNVRSDVGDVSSLAASIKSTGLMQPIVVYAPYEGDIERMHEIVAGHRRYAAHQLAGLPTIDAIVRARPDDEAESTAARIVENVQREDLSVLDEARAYAALATAPFSWSQRQIATAVGVNQSHVSKRIKLASLPDPVLEAVGGGSCRVEDALTLATLIEEDPQAGAEIIAKGNYHWADRALSVARAERKRRETIEKARAAHKAGDGPPVHPASEEAPWSALVLPGVLAVDHYQFRDAKVTRDQIAADGNLAVLVCRDGSIEEVCTDPSAYELKVGTSKPKRRPFDIATERRRAFITKLLSSENREPPAAHEALIQVLVEVALPALNGSQLAEIANALDLGLKKSAGYRELQETLAGLLASDGPRSNGQVLAARRIADAMMICHGEARIHGDYGDPRPDQVAHLRRLEAAGHELHKAERDWLAKADDVDDADDPTGEIAPL